MKERYERQKCAVGFPSTCIIIPVLYEFRVEHQCAYVQYKCRVSLAPWSCRSVLMTSSLLMTLLNWRGLDIVGKSAEVIVLVTMLPFVVLGVMAIPHINVRNWGISRPLREVQWSEYLNVMFWCANSLPSLPSCA